MKELLASDFARARQLLQEAGYDGTPIVLLHSTDVAGLANLAPVAKALMEQAGFKVDMHSSVVLWRSSARLSGSPSA